MRIRNRAVWILAILIAVVVTHSFCQLGQKERIGAPEYEIHSSPAPVQSSEVTVNDHVATTESWTRASLIRTISPVGGDRHKAIHLDKQPSQHRLAVLVPFRNRFEELLQFAPHMQRFLSDQAVDYKIFVLNQVDKHRFNRASLLNAGFLSAEQLGYDYFALHDVDLLPLNPNLNYHYPETGPYHVAAPWLHPKYSYPTFVGGILLMTAGQLRRVNGLTNLFWGWGGEDDDLYKRMRKFHLAISRPKRYGFGTNRHNTFKHIHTERRERDMGRYFNQTVVAYRFDQVTGLSDVRYTLESTVDVTVKGAPVTVLNIQLECNYQLTPYCDVPTEPPKTK